MDGSLTGSQMHLPCPLCGKMELQSWTVVMAINKLFNSVLIQSWYYSGYFAKLPPLKSWFDPAETPKDYSVLLPWEWPVQMTGEIMRFCIDDVS